MQNIVKRILLGTGYAAWQVRTVDETPQPAVTVKANESKL
jgi:hypothetical protein